MNLMNKNMISFITAVSFMMCACTDTTVIPAGDYDSMKGSGSGNPDAERAVSSIEPLANPDRGYHLECRYFAHNLVNPFNSSEEYPKGFVDDREITYSSKDGSTKIVQQYIYLTRYARKDIDEQGLENVQKVFDELKDKGYKAILRFAYNWWGENQYNSNWKDEEEAEEWIYRHIERLAPVLQRNIGLIAAMQAGFLGRWGEWHNTSVLLGPNAQRVKNGVVNKLLAAIPHRLRKRSHIRQNNQDVHALLKCQVLCQCQGYLWCDQTLNHRIICQIDEHGYVGGNTALFKGAAEEISHIVFDTHSGEYDSEFLVRILSQRSLLYDLCSQLIVWKTISGKDRKLLSSDQGGQSVDCGNTGVDIVSGIFTCYWVQRQTIDV